MNDSLTVAFLGAGRMATALAKGFCTQGLNPGNVSAVDPFDSARDAFTSAVGGHARVSSTADEAFLNADVLFLAVKPAVILELLADLSDRLNSEQLIVSIAAGIPLNRLENAVRAGTRAVRVMPNTPCLVGVGACGVTAGSAATADDIGIVSRLLESVGIVEVVPESQLDAVTGLSGSGPAYVFQMIEALSDGGVKMGLPRTTARLAAQTLAGAARMVLETGEHPGTLKDAVTSPGGTTIAALHELEAGGLRATLIRAVETATRRSKELGE